MHQHLSTEPAADLSQRVRGTLIAHATIVTALSNCPDPFQRMDFEQLLATAASDPTTITAEVSKRVLQTLRRKGVVTYDAGAHTWRKVAPKGVLATPEIAPSQTLLMTMEPDKPLPESLPEQPAQPTEKTVPIPPSRFDLRAAGQSFLAFFACTAIVVALVTINAGFAWELAENEAFRFAFVAGLTACDLMRPLLVAQGLYEMDRHRAFRGSAAILVAVSLAPVSVLSSTSVIGATLHLGVEENDQAAARAASLEALRPEHDRLKALGADLWQAYRDECARGGCGKIAAGIKEKAEVADAEAAEVLAEIVGLTSQGNGTSAFIARTVKSFEDLKLFGPDRTMLIPMLLALTLEVAALFGPGLLLTQRRVSRATL